MSRRLAVISDVHGNVWALAAVLDDIDRRGISAIVDLGDSVHGPLEPAATMEIMASRGILAIAGNEDRVITEPEAERVMEVFEEVTQLLSS